MKCDNTLLDPGAASVVDPDERDAKRRRKVNDLVDLFSGHLAQGPPVHGEILGKNAYFSSVDCPEAGYDPVGVGPFVLGRPLRAALGKHVELLKGPRVQEIVDALPGSHLAA